MISGVIVGDGQFVLTQGDLLAGAKEIAVALTTTEVLDAVVERVDPEHNVGLLRLEKPVKVPLALLTELPPGEIAALIIGAPESFKTSRTQVRLQPVAGQTLWRLIPAVPPAFRGAPIFSVSGTLLGIAIERRPGDFPDAVPLPELRALLAAASAEGAAPGTLPEAAVKQQERAADSAAARPPPPEKSEPAAGPPSAAAPEKPGRGQDEKAEKQAAPPAGGKATEAKPAEAEPVKRPEVEPAQPPQAQEKPAAVPSPPASQPAPANAPQTLAPAGEAPAPGQSAKQQAAPASALSAVEQWQERIAKQPDNIGLRFAFADALIEGNLYGRAVQTLEQARKEFPSNAMLYWHLAHAYWQQALHKADGSPRTTMDREPYHKCMAAFETFIKMVPDDPRAPEARLRLDQLRRASAR